MPSILKVDRSSARPVQEEQMRVLIVALVITLVGQSWVSHIHACGDKTMRVKTGLRFYQAQASKNPSKILILSSALPTGKAEELKEFLNKVGHKATAASNLSSIKNSLRTSQYDLVFTDLAEASDLQSQVQSFTPKTVVVPVLLKQPKSEAQAAGKQFKVVVNKPVDGIDFLIAVARVMNSQSHRA